MCIWSGFFFFPKPLLYLQHRWKLLCSNKLSLLNSVCVCVDVGYPQVPDFESNFGLIHWAIYAPFTCSSPSVIWSNWVHIFMIYEMFLYICAHEETPYGKPKRNHPSMNSIKKIRGKNFPQHLQCFIVILSLLQLLTVHMTLLCCTSLDVLSARVALYIYFSFFPPFPPLFKYKGSRSRGRFGSFMEWCRTSPMKLGIKYWEQCWSHLSKHKTLWRSFPTMERHCRVVPLGRRLLGA